MRRILVVEGLAHSDYGHLPVLFAELARALADAGCHVDVLTSNGWVLDQGGDLRPFEVRRLRGPLRWLHNAGHRLTGRQPRRFTRRIGGMIQTVALVLGARQTARSEGISDVIVTSHGLDAFLATTLCGSGRRWLFYQFSAVRLRPPRLRHLASTWPPLGTSPNPILRSVAHVAHRIYTARGSTIRVAVNNEPDRLAWQVATPWFAPVRAPFVAVRTIGQSERHEVCRSLPRDKKVALLFGAPHALKDYDVVWRAFADVEEWHLVVAGAGSASMFRRWAAASPHTVTPTLLEGFVSDDERDQLFASADAVVLSFKPGANADSGTLINAITAGVPVVCSSDSFAGQEVEELQLGPTFAPGDHVDLIRALRLVPSSLEQATLERARRRHSPEALARTHLDALGLRTQGGRVDATARQRH